MGSDSRRAALSPARPDPSRYELRLHDGQECGGAYLKLLDAERAQSLDKLDNGTPYIIMFGPDKCGATNKVHFILRHQNPVSGEWEEKHMKTAVPFPAGAWADGRGCGGWGGAARLG